MPKNTDSLTNAYPTACPRCTTSTQNSRNIVSLQSAQELLSVAYCISTQWSEPLLTAYWYEPTPSRKPRLLKQNPRACMSQRCTLRTENRLTLP